jgi:hypothetical protein
MHYLIDILQGHVVPEFVHKVHPIGAAILLQGVGIVTGLHITSIVCSIGYTLYCAYLKRKEHQNNTKK